MHDHSEKRNLSGRSHGDQSSKHRSSLSLPKLEILNLITNSLIKNKYVSVGEILQRGITNSAAHTPFVVY